MSGVQFKLDAQEFERLIAAIKAFGDGAEDAVNGVLHGRGADVIKAEIHKLLPESGRVWDGKPVAAKKTDPFKAEGFNLGVTVKSKPDYYYLYFPDDGGNSNRHAGNQQFMRRGGEAATQEVIDMCVEALTKTLD